MYYKELMTEEQKKVAHIQELSYDFACRIVRLYQQLTGETTHNPDPIIQNLRREFVMSKQLYRCGTSVGANVRESHHAQSDADFLSKMSIASKEADESDFWLNILHDNGYLNDNQFASLDIDCKRLNRILTSIVKSMREKIDGKKNPSSITHNT